MARWNAALGGDAIDAAVVAGSHHAAHFAVFDDELFGGGQRDQRDRQLFLVDPFAEQVVVALAAVSVDGSRPARPGEARDAVQFFPFDAHFGESFVHLDDMGCVFQPILKQLLPLVRW